MSDWTGVYTDINNIDLISVFNIYYRFLTVQTESESTNNENTDADILFSSFNIYSDLAINELDNLLTSRSIPDTYITNNQYNALICHLIADYFEQGNPDWNFRSQSQAPGVSFSRGQTTGPREAFNKLFESIATAVRMSSVSSGRGSSISFNRIKDAANYPKRWKRTVIPAYDQSENGFDSDEVDDSGYDDRYNTGNQWS
jgi:hypothetical protein